MPLRTIQESHRPRVSDRTMRCHSLSGSPSGLYVSETNGVVTKGYGTTGKRERFSASRTETKRLTRPEEDHSRIEGARSNIGAECRENISAPSRRGDFSLDISFYRTATSAWLPKSYSTERPQNKRKTTHRDHHWNHSRRDCVFWRPARLTKKHLCDARLAGLHSLGSCYHPERPPKISLP